MSQPPNPAHARPAANRSRVTVIVGVVLGLASLLLLAYWLTRGGTGDRAGAPGPGASPRPTTSGAAAGSPSVRAGTPPSPQAGSRGPGGSAAAGAGGPPPTGSDGPVSRPSSRPA